MSQGRRRSARPSASAPAALCSPGCPGRRGERRMRAILCVAPRSAPMSWRCADRRCRSPAPAVLRLGPGRRPDFADPLMLAAATRTIPAAPFTPGLEVAGKIDAVGVGVGRSRVGRRVMAFSIVAACRYALARAATSCRSPRHGRGDGRRLRRRLRDRPRRAHVARRPACRARRCWSTAPPAASASPRCSSAKAIGATVIATARGPDSSRSPAGRRRPAWTAREPDVVEGGSCATRPAGKVPDVVFDPVGGAVRAASLKA